MASDNSTAINYTYSDGGAHSNSGGRDSGSGGRDSRSGDEPYQFLEVRMIFYMRIICGVTGLFLHDTPRIQLETALFNIPLHEQNDDPVFLQIYIADLLSTINIVGVACEVISGQIASYILQITGENRDTNFHVNAVIDNITYAYALPIQVYGGGEIGREAPAERFRMEKLEENGEEDLGACCICLDEIDCKMCEVVRIPCGHVYHKPCISTWLDNSNSCPLCRRPCL